MSRERPPGARPGKHDGRRPKWRALARLLAAALAVAAAGCAVSAEGWRRRAPATREPEPVVVDSTRETDLGHGLVVVTAVEPALPLAALRVGWARGSAFDPPGRAGLARLCTALVLESRPEPGGPILAHALDDLGAEVQLTVHHAMATIAVVVRSDLLPRAAELIAAALGRLDVDPDAFVRLRTRLRDQLQAAERTPDHLAEAALLAALYGAGAPGAAAPQGTSASVAALTLDDVRGEHARVLAAPWSLSFAGRIDAGEALVLARTSFARARPATGDERGEPRLGRPPAPPGNGGPAVLVPLADVTQTLLGIGRVTGAGTPAASAALEAALVARAGVILTELRHRRGHTYGVEPSRERGAEPGLATIVTKLEPDALPLALAAVRGSLYQTIRAIRRPGYSALVRGAVSRRLHAAGDGLLARTFAHAERLALGRGPAWEPELPRAAAALTAEQTEAALRRELDPGAWRLVVVGDPAAARRALEDAGLPFVEWRPAAASP